MKKVRKNIEEVLEHIAYAEAGEYGPHHKQAEKTDALEDVFTAMGMAEGGDEDYAKRLHPLFRIKQGGKQKKRRRVIGERN